VSRAVPRVHDPRVDAARAGDSAAVAALLAELLPRVRVWLYRLLGPRADLDDATQEALTELALAIPRFAGDAQLSTYAHTISVRTAYRFFARPVEVGLELVPPAAEELDPESRAMAREALRRLHRGLGRLRPNRRVAFVLCAIEGLTPAEAARVEGCSGLAMRSRLKHARAELERLLAHDPYVGAFVRGGGRCARRWIRSEVIT
jgi:RNA polymerase sigma-70 factor (ECF subfamily)